MTDKPRYQLRANSVALPRFQWWIVGIAILVAVVGVFLAFTRGTAFGTIMMSLSSLVVAFTIVSAKGPNPSK
jgi:hypothetical protein